LFTGSRHSAVLAVLTTAVALCGCGNSNFDTSGAWFSKPVDLFGSRGGYSYSNLNDTAKLERPITANDLIGANGACPVPPAPAAPPTPPQNAGANPDGNAALSADVANLIGGGVAIGMSECEVMGRLGRPTALNFGNNPSGVRSVILTYDTGSRPGVYRFQAGRLTEMDRAQVAPPPEPAKKKIAKKKPVKPKEPANTDDKT